MLGVKEVRVENPSSVNMMSDLLAKIKHNKTLLLVYYYKVLLMDVKLYWNGGSEGF